jgi:guanine nucleotide-binding protein subunit alpha, other
MGNCVSGGAAEVSDEDKRRHREAEKSLKEVRVESRYFLSFYHIYAYF